MSKKLHYFKIPSEVLKDTDLNPNEKILLSIVWNFKSKRLTLTNDKLADWLNLKDSETIAKMIDSLHSREYVEVLTNPRTVLLSKEYPNNFLKVHSFIYDNKQLTNGQKIILSKISDLPEGADGYQYKCNELALQIGMKSSYIKKHKSILEKNQFIIVGGTKRNQTLRLGDKATKPEYRMVTESDNMVTEPDNKATKPEYRMVIKPEDWALFSESMALFSEDKALKPDCIYGINNLIKDFLNNLGIDTTYLSNSILEKNKENKPNDKVAIDYLEPNSKWNDTITKNYNEFYKDGSNASQMLNEVPEYKNSYQTLNSHLIEFCNYKNKTQSKWKGFNDFESNFSRWANKQIEKGFFHGMEMQKPAERRKRTLTKDFNNNWDSDNLPAHYAGSSQRSKAQTKEIVKRIWRKELTNDELDFIVQKTSNEISEDDLIDVLVYAKTNIMSENRKNPYFVFGNNFEKYLKYSRQEAEETKQTNKRNSFSKEVLRIKKRYPALANATFSEEVYISILETKNMSEEEIIKITDSVCHDLAKYNRANANVFVDVEQTIISQNEPPLVYSTKNITGMENFNNSRAKQNNAFVKTTNWIKGTFPTLAKSYFIESDFERLEEMKGIPSYYQYFVKSDRRNHIKDGLSELARWKRYDENIYSYLLGYLRDKLIEEAEIG